ncbi:MAG: hypothetical protein II776_06675, partial [Clostridia bacterium]|nr:hypothetical protein [Clostridia bacterium]
MKGSYSDQVREAVSRRTMEDLGVLARDRGRFSPCCAASFLRAVFLTIGRREGDEIVFTSGHQALLEIC